LGATATTRDPVAVDTRLALAAAALRTGDVIAAREATQSLTAVIETVPASGAAAGASPTATASPSPSATPFQ
jgi:hypothetical protein